MSEENSQEESVSAQGAPRDAVLPKVIDHALAARMLIREGKPWRECALAAGYAESVAMRGLRQVMAESSSLTDAIKAEEKRINVSMDRLKPLAINRLYHEILNAHSSNGMKAIELAGRFKETDWFVRQSETNIGILLNLQEQVGSPESPVIDILP